MGVHANNQCRSVQFRRVSRIIRNQSTVTAPRGSRFLNTEFKTLMRFLIGLLALAFAQTATADEKLPPNVLFLVTDDCNCDLSCYGHSLVRTPSLDRLAKRGVRFTHAYAQYPVCNPSRSSFLTSLYPDQTGVLNNAGNFRKQHPNVVTMPQMFRNHGYTAIRIGKLYHYAVPNQIGTDGEDDLASWDIRINPRGIDREVHEQIHSIRPDAPIESRFGGTLSWLKVDQESEEHTDGVAATEAIRIMKELHPERTKRPFFLAVGFYRPHTPYVAPARLFDLYPLDQIIPELEIPTDRDDIPLAALHDRPGQRELTVAQRKDIIQAYYASVSLMDEQLGRVTQALTDLNLSDNTIVVFISDHGYHLGAHGLWQKSDLFEGSCRVPMIVSAPGVSQNGRTATGPVELLDLYPTLAELAGVTPPDHLKGTSLVPMLKDPTASAKPGALSVTVSRARQMHKEFTKSRVMGYSIRTERYRYTEWGNGVWGKELYDYETDPKELTNLAKKPEHQKTMAKLKATLDAAKERAVPGFTRAQQ